MYNSRMLELTALLNKANKEYYVENKSNISDKRYDELYDELAQLETQTGIILSGSPTITVGDIKITGGLKKVQHTSSVLSLDKTKDPNALREFLGDHVGVLSWKEDGLTGVIEYNHGRLVQAVTRGRNGIGEDVTHNANVISNLPYAIQYQGYLKIRGEFIVSHSNFTEINNKLIVLGEEPFKNARNYASGSVRQLENKISKERNIDFVAFAIQECDELFEKKSEQLEYLNMLGFCVVDYKLVHSAYLQEAINYFQSQLESYKYPTDGLVLTFDDINYSISLGETSKYPQDSKAFKWNDYAIETKYKHTLWQTSRTGLINPVAVFEPVIIDGTEITQASLFNLDIFEELQLGQGDLITIYKANMIIPQIDENLTRSNTELIPQYCSACGHPTTIATPKASKYLFCNNADCIGKNIASLAHFVDKEGFNIVGLSEATLEKLYMAGLVKNYTDIFKLFAFNSTIISLEGFNVRSAKKLLDSVEKARQVAIPNFINALGIRLIGLSTAKKIAKHFNHDIDAILSATFQQLIKVESISEITANAFLNHIKTHTDIIRELIELVQFVIPKNISNKFTNLTFVITGSVSQFNNRNEMKQWIESNGGTVASSVSKKTHYLINNDIHSNSGKNKDAKKLQDEGYNIQIITEDTLLAM